MVEKEGNHWWEKNLKNSNSLIVPFWYSLWYSLPCCRALSWQRTCTNYLPGCLPFIPTTSWGGGLKGGGGRFQIDKRIVCRLQSPPSLCNELPICADLCALFINLCVSIFVIFFQSWTFLRELFRFDLSSCNVIKRETCKFHNPIIILDHPVRCSERAHIWISIVLQQMSHI